MDNIMILVSGVPGVGKSTFAGWLAGRIKLPVVRYDRLVRKVRELAPDAANGGDLAYELFLFELEEHMDAAFITDYIFSVKQEGWLEQTAKAHGCKVINVHFDCSPETAYARYTQRNARETGVKIRPDVTLEAYTQVTAQNRDFLWGDHLIRVDAEDFSRVSYEGIWRELAPLLGLETE